LAAWLGVANLPAVLIREFAEADWPQIWAIVREIDR
jgi:hypothetical protein